MYGNIGSRQLSLFYLCQSLWHIFSFKISLGVDFLVAEWSAGDLLSYVSGFEAFVGTGVLSWCSCPKSAMKRARPQKADIPISAKSARSASAGREKSWLNPGKKWTQVSRCSVWTVPNIKLWDDTPIDPGNLDELYARMDTAAENCAGGERFGGQFGYV